MRLVVAAWCYLRCCRLVSTRGHRAAPLMIIRSPVVAPLRHRVERRARSGRRRLSDPAQDLRGRSRHDRQQQHGGDAQRFGDIEQHLRQPRPPAPGRAPAPTAPCSAMYSLAASTMRKAAAAPPSSAKRVHVRRDSRPALAAATSARRPASPAAATRPPRYFSAIVAMRLTRLPRLFARSTL